MADSVEEIAIIGMSGAFPGAKNIHELWKLLLEKREGIASLSRDQLLAAGEDPEAIDDPAYVARGGYLDGAEAFDAAFFGVNPGEAAVTDPQHRLMLEHSFLALEDAGYDPATAEGLIGVFAGQGIPEYWFLQKEAGAQGRLADYQLMLGNDKDFLASRVSYRLNLRGPSMSVQTACSSSLASVAIACQSLLAFGCDMALAGGVSIAARRNRGYLYYDGMIYSKTGACRPFDADADGAAFGEGVGVVCLKRLSEALADGDYVYAVIKSLGMNNDGSGKVGFAAPSVAGQAEAIELAQALADVEPGEIGYVETHGTATALGDAVEVEALTKAFGGRSGGKGYCRLGSIKANIGHADAAAGIAGLIKTALVVNTGAIPPQLNFSKPNPRLGLEDGPFRINAEAAELPLRAGRRLAGVSSFGVGGTNVHAILQSPPPRETGGRPPSGPEGDSRPPLLLSAKSPDALAARKAALADFLEREPGTPIGDLVAKVGRPSHGYAYRWGSRAESAAHLLKALGAPALPPSQATSPAALFVFPGQGAQYPAMARGFYGKLRTFSEWIDRGIELSRGLGLPDFRRLLLEDGDPAELAETYLAQCLIFIVEYALARELLSRGIEPVAVAGHSVGEYAAAAVAGVLDFEEGLRLVARRGYWMQQAPRGAMIALALSADEAAAYLSDDVWLCLCNSPSQTVLGGRLEAIDALEARLAAESRAFTRLKTSHAFHSPLMDGILEGFAAEVRAARFGKARLPFLSNADGSWMPEGADWASYWPAQIRNPVRFDLCIGALKALPDIQVLEVGPGKVLSGFFLSAGAQERGPLPLLPSARAEPGSFEDCLIRLWERGMAVRGLEADRAPSSLVLAPGYAFDRTRFWVEAAPAASDRAPAATGEPSAPERHGQASGIAPSHGDGVKERIIAIWRRVIGAPPSSDDASFFLSGGDSFSGLLMAESLRRELGVDFGIRDLLLHPSVSALLSRLGGKGGDQVPHDRFVFPIQTSGSKPPLFMVAGAHQNRYHDPELGNSYAEDFFRYFSTMIGALGTDQPLYGFKPKGLALGEHYHTSVEVMASAFISSMKKVKPAGPYYIGGECVGGIVAYEMARQLEASGDEVGALILLDTPRPSAASAVAEEALIAWHSLTRAAKDILRAPNGKMRARAESASKCLAAALCMAFPLTKGLRAKRRALGGSQHYERVLFRYRPSGGFSGRVALLMNRKWNRGSFLKGWRRDLGPIMLCYEIPGTHDNRLKKSGRLVGRIIAKIIEHRA